MTMRLHCLILGLIVAIVLPACAPSMLSGALSPTITIQASATPLLTVTRLPVTKTPRPPATQAPTALATPATLAQNSAFVFVSETIPDGTNFLPGQNFRKTWTIRNSGTSNWAKGFTLVKVSSTPANETLGTLERIQLPKEVKPGETIQIGMDLAAPKQNGRYIVYYQLQDEKGSILLGSQIWVNITVGNVASSASVGMAAGGINTANGVTATLSRFTSDAQSASIGFCMSVSFHQYTLVPAPSLLIDQKPAPFLTGSSHFESGPGCMEMTYQASAAEVEQAQHITLLLDGSLRQSPPPGDPNVACQTARLILIKAHPGLDFQCHFSMAGYYTHLQQPEEMTRDQANTLITDTIEEAIYGPWTLTIK